ncbi:hypothetical protein [Latilactobacillus curvatus]|uniref:hypothetical protein n=1 Tax=Latilactobacillus curvatus TaxID=28038 RepID=UPI00223B1D87|nr:hypothetical protein [Latilactobacillus curvatus]MCS8618129.1 hypothetical protein [Latilactobacillus curvatus]
MFNAMMRYRLAAIWRGLLMAIAVFVIITGGSILIFSNQMTWKAFWFTLLSGSLVVSQLVLIFLSFATTRKPFNFGILNGIPRSISYTTQVISLFSSQLISFLTLYGGTYFIAAHQSGINRFFLDSRFVLLAIVLIWTIMAEGIAISSFITLFERKAWLFLFAAWLILSTLYQHYIEPAIERMLPSWVDTFVLNIPGDQPMNQLANLFHQPIFWISGVIGILIPLVIAGICQHFMQTKRMAIRFKRFAR